MRRLKPTLLASGLLAAAALWAGPAAWATPFERLEREEKEELALWPAGTEAPVELTEPRHGETLVAGTPGAVEWAGRLEELEGKGFDEWEAFLSLDGGKTFPIRLTPHLELDTQRVSFEVPNTPTDDARLLLRFGDGRHDWSWRLPHRFAIAPSPAPLPSFDRIAALARFETEAEWEEEREREAKAGEHKEWEREVGERPLPGHPGVSAWVEGTAEGEGLHWVFAERDRLSAAEAPVVRAAELAELALDRPSSPSVPAPAVRDQIAAPHARPAVFAASLPHPPSREILTWTQRRNE